MEKAYWLDRKRASLTQNATSADTRLTHYDLARDLNALAAETKAIDLAALPRAIACRASSLGEVSSDA